MKRDYPIFSIKRRRNLGKLSSLGIPILESTPRGAPMRRRRPPVNTRAQRAVTLRDEIRESLERIDDKRRNLRTMESNLANIRNKLQSLQSLRGSRREPIQEARQQERPSRRDQSPPGQRVYNGPRVGQPGRAVRSQNTQPQSGRPPIASRVDRRPPGGTQAPRRTVNAPPGHEPRPRGERVLNPSSNYRKIEEKILSGGDTPVRDLGLARRSAPPSQEELDAYQFEDTSMQELAAEEIEAAQQEITDEPGHTDSGGDPEQRDDASRASE